jgi:hypothetical protein
MNQEAGKGVPHHVFVQLTLTFTEERDPLAASCALLAGLKQGSGRVLWQHRIEAFTAFGPLTAPSVLGWLARRWRGRQCGTSRAFPADHRPVSAEYPIKCIVHNPTLSVLLAMLQQRMMKF